MHAGLGLNSLGRQPDLPSHLRVAVGGVAFPERQADAKAVVDFQISGMVFGKRPAMPEIPKVLDRLIQIHIFPPGLKSPGKC